MLLTPIHWLDVWQLCHSLYARRQKLGKPQNGVRTLTLIDGDWKAPELKDWATLTNMLSRCTRLLRERAPDCRISAAAIECLDPGAVIPWEHGSDDEVEAHVAIVVNPFARLFAGLETYCPGWGEVVLLSPSTRAMKSAVNMGETPRIHLILTMTKAQE